MTSRAWCYTINHVPQLNNDGGWDDGEHGSDRQGPLHLSDIPHAKWHIYAVEVGEGGHLHIQGYMCFSRPVRLRHLRVHAEDVHWEPRRGTHDEAKAYCCKDPIGDVVEEGVEPKGQGNRSDLQEATDQLMNHRDLTKLAQEHPTWYVKFNRGFEALLNQTDQSPQRSPLRVYYFWGSPGTGKTWFVMNHPAYKGKIHILSDQKAIWWDGYMGEQVLLIDDLELDTISLVRMLQLLQHYPLKVPKKGGFIRSCWDIVWITSNYHPDAHYSSAPLPRRQAWLRRLTTVYNTFENPPPGFQVYVAPPAAQAAAITADPFEL